MTEQELKASEEFRKASGRDQVRMIRELRGSAVQLVTTSQVVEEPEEEDEHPSIAFIRERNKKSEEARASGWKTFDGAKFLVGDVQKDDGAKATKYAGIIRLSKFTNAQKDLLLKLLSERSGVSIAALKADAKEAEQEAADRVAPETRKKSPDGWPDGYTIHDGSLCFERKDGERTYYDRLCTALEIVGTARDELSGQWALILKFKNRVGKVQEVNLTFANILSDPGKTIAVLSNAGLKIDGDKDRKARLFTCLSRVETTKHIVAVNQPGLYDGAMVTPIGKVVNGDASLLRLRNHKTALVVKDRDQKGTLDAWKLNVNKALELLDFHGPVVMSTGFAGTLVELLGIDTITLFLFGGSSSGKSFVEKMAATIDATPENKMGLFHSGNTHVPGLERALASATGACLHLDDLLKNLPDQKLLPQLPFMLQGGTGRSRGTADGGEQETKHWRCTVTISGEEKYAVAMQRAVKDSYVSGQDVRFIPISLAGAKVQTESAGRNAIKILERRMAQNYGWAREEFVRHALRLDLDTLADRIQDEADKLLALGADDNLRARAAYSLAVCLVAGLMAQEIKLLPEGDGVRKAFEKAWLASIGNPDETVGNTAEAGLEKLQTRAVVTWAAHAKALENMADPDQPGQSRSDTWFVYGQSLKLRGHQYVAVSKDQFRELVAPADPDAVLKLMAARNMLIRKADGKNPWPSLGGKVFPHYKVIADHIGPSLGVVDDDDGDAAPVDDGSDTVETPQEKVNRIAGELQSLGVIAPNPPVVGASDLVWQCHAQLLLAMQADRERVIREG